MQIPTQRYCSSSLMVRGAFHGGVFHPPQGNGGENIGTRGIVGTRPNSDFINGTKTAKAQAIAVVHFADIDAGRGDHSDEHEAMLLITHHFDSLKGFVATDAGEDDEIMTLVTGT